MVEFASDNYVIDYKVANGPKPVWAIVVDLNVSEDELEEIKKALMDEIAKIENVSILIITFGKNVILNDLISPFLSESLINGETEYSADSLRSLLHLKVSENSSANFNRFV